MLDRAAKQPLEEQDAASMCPPSDNAHTLAADFERVYEKVKARYAGPPDSASRPAPDSASRPGGRPRQPWTSLTGITLLRLHWWPMFLESVWVLVEVGQRLGTPVALREFLRWLQRYSAGSDPPQWEGWMWAVILGACGLSMVIIHHQFFWVSMRAAFLMRQQAIAAVHAKVLRLNSAAVSALSTGHVVNLVSNDVRRFDDAVPFWIFLWAAPLELAMVLLMVSLELDFPSALAGVATSLALIPTQSALVRYIGGLRRNTARCTDERVRLAGEVVEGALAMKMLSWEDPFTDALRSIRGRETHFSRRMQRIRGINFALQFAITPIVSFVTFAVYRARNGTLNVASVFYALSLLNLPKLYMVNFFVLGVQTMTELRVSLQRIDSFLSTPEPTAPHSEASLHRGAAPHPQQPPRHGRRSSSSGKPGAPGAPRASADGESAAAPGANAGSGVLRRSLELVLGGVRRSWEAAQGRQAANGTGAAGGGEARPASPVPPASGYVALCGADYDWARPFGRDDVRLSDTHGTALGGGGGGKASGGKASGGGAKAADGGGKGGKGGEVITKGAPEQGDAAAVGPSGGSSGGAGGLTLCGVRFAASPGELLGICGSVGSGKSSLLAALLGELQPLRRGGAGGGHSAERADGAAAAAGACAAAAEPATGDAAASVAAPGGPDDTQAGLPTSLVQLQLDGRGAECGGGVEGGPIVRGRVAYCSQVPWIVAGSVRENILFGCAWEEAWYGKVVHACCLADDLAGLPAGDATELGERGINLSGGQKARVALARAVYARPAVALLDDPLSAVDPRVGRELFQRAIGPGGLLEACGATRLLVTHQRQYLPKCDRVMVLRGGRVVALAGWRQLAALQLPELTAGHGGVGARGGADAEEADDDRQAGEAGAAAEGPATVDEALDDLAAAAEAKGEAALTAGADTSPEAMRCIQGRGAADGSDSGGGGSSAASGSGTGSDDAALAVLADPRVGPGGPGREHQQQQAMAEPVGAVKAQDVGGGGGGTAAAAGGLSFFRLKSLGGGGGGGGGRGGSGTADRYRLSLSRTFAAGLGRGASGRLQAQNSQDKGAQSGAPQAGDAGKLVQSEDRVTGTVSWAVYGRYCAHAGGAASGLVVVSMFAGQAVYLASDWWLALWSRADPGDQSSSRWLWVYGLLTGIVIAVSFLRSVTFFEATLSAATSIHNAMARRVLRAPLSFFHTNPSGRIVNRFSKDQGQVDDLLPSCMFDALQSAFVNIGALVLVAIAVPVILPVFLPLAAAFFWIRRRYITASREVKRWEAVTRSPVFASFSATLKGLPTIRAYGASERFQSCFLDLMAHNGDWYFAFISTSRWIGVRLDAVAGTALLAAALLAVAMRDRLNTGVMALALTHVLQLTGLMQWVVRQSAEVENTMTSVERMLAYTLLPSEPPRVAEGAPAPPPGWPRSGALEYANVTAVYRPGLPPVLRDLSFSLAPGSSCGVVGRTGSGKSSLMLTLFRLIDVTHGSIRLDGLDTSSIGLDALRRQLAIIPQDPVLFSGTLRSNLDPWRTHSDAELWGVLSAVQLRDSVAALPGGLDGGMAECGGNLSVGQRQLFCLARALLQDAKVLALDEATANVDRATDELIQRALRDFAHRDRERHGRVLLVIAHRIDTILDTDHLLVLNSGTLVESGPPAQLAAGGGVFGRMVAAARLAGGVAATATAALS